MHAHHHAPHPVTFEDSIRFHGHTCPGLASGYRAATAAMEALGVTALKMRISSLSVRPMPAVWTRYR
jgi:formylmethanofuran dehydrogenase subunit E